MPVRLELESLGCSDPSMEVKRRADQASHGSLCRSFLSTRSSKNKRTKSQPSDSSLEPADLSSPHPIYLLLFIMKQPQRAEDVVVWSVS